MNLPLCWLTGSGDTEGTLGRTSLQELLSSGRSGRHPDEQPRAARAVSGWRREIRIVFSEEVMRAGVEKEGFGKGVRVGETF